MTNGCSRGPMRDAIKAGKKREDFLIAKPGKPMKDQKEEAKKKR